MTKSNIAMNIDLFIGNLQANYAITPSMRDGSLNYPFVDITDAIKYGKE